MTVHDLYFWIAAHQLPALAAVFMLPLAIGALALFFRVLGRRGGSQQVANVGIAVGLAAVFIETVALAYVVFVQEINPLEEANVLLLCAPLYLLVAGFGIGVEAPHHRAQFVEPAF